MDLTHSTHTDRSLKVAVRCRLGVTRDPFAFQEPEAAGGEGTSGKANGKREGPTRSGTHTLASPGRERMSCPSSESTQMLSGALSLCVALLSLSRCPESGPGPQLRTCALEDAADDAAADSATLSTQHTEPN